MKVHYECAACFLRQAREALDQATTDESLKMRVMEDLTRKLGDSFRQGAVANQIGTAIHRDIKQQTDNPDPYQEQRKKCNQIALKFLPLVEKILQEDGSLKNYLLAAITGNVIDFGALGLGTDIEALVLKTMHQDLALDHSPLLEEELQKAGNVLYLADNIGEIVFDKLLISKLNEYGVDVTVALKEEPILNDACIPDAREIKLEEVARLTSTGTDSIGVIYDDLSPDFRETFHKADLVIAKGLGNYEGLDEMNIGDKPVFCLLNAKCKPIARDIGVEVGDNVVLMLNHHKGEVL